MNIVNIPNAQEFADALSSENLFVYTNPSGVVVFRTAIGGWRADETAFVAGKVLPREVHRLRNDTKLHIKKARGWTFQWATWKTIVPILEPFCDGPNRKRELCFLCDTFKPCKHNKR